MTDKKTENKEEVKDKVPLTEKELQMMELREAVAFSYDLQKLRIQQGNRAGAQSSISPAILDDEKHKKFLGEASDNLSDLEKKSFKEIGRLLKKHEIYNTWLKDQKGVGPAMAGIIVANIDIYKADAVSNIWSYCGLGVVNGKAACREKGKKAGYDPFLKAKMTEVLGGSFLKCKSPWRDFYDNYKNRKANCIVDVCPVCRGSFSYGPEKKPCYMCDAGKKVGPYPWAKSDAHLHQASIRYMVKMFLKELYVQWRTIEGLPVRKPYEEEYLNRASHESRH